MFSLLVMAVCVTVAAVVLHAGTASAGRVAELAAMDERFYSVDSAVGVLADSLDGRTVTVVRTCATTTTTQTKSADGALTTVGTPTSSSAYSVRYSDGQTISLGESFLSDMVVAWLFGEDFASTDKGAEAAWSCGQTSALADTKEESYQISLVSGEEELEELSVLVDAELTDRGVLTLTLSTASEGDRYERILTFHLQREDEETTAEQELSNTYAAATGIRTVKTQLTDTLTTTVTCTFSSDRKGDTP